MVYYIPMGIEIATKKSTTWGETGLWISATPDDEINGKWFFTENRIIPIFYFFPEYHFAYIIKVGHGKLQLPLLTGNGKILLRAKSGQTRKLENTIYALRKMNIDIDCIKEGYFKKLEQFLYKRRFSSVNVANYINSRLINEFEGDKL